MLDGINDTDQHAKELIQLARLVRCKLNLIPFNPFPESGLKRSPSARVKVFAQRLMDAGIVTTVRKTRGDDIDAACGQLAGKCATAPGSPSATPHSARPYQLNRCMHDAGIGFRSGVRDVRGRYWKDRLGAARAARIKGWSVDEVSSRIKFSARQIEALENEQWADLPSGVSLRGLIRNYARLLGADSQAIVESLDPKERVTGPVKLSPARCIPRIPFPSPGPTTSVPRRRPGAG